MSEKISVIVPVYNVEKYLPKCVESLLAQTHKNIEIILVDDGSPDTCPALCDQSHSDNPLKVKVIHKPNGGVMSARCAGVEAATGDYIGFVDGDDFVEPDMYEFLLGLIKRTGADIAQCGIRSVNEDEAAAEIEQKEDHREESLCGTDALKKIVYGAFIWSNLWPKLYRKSLFDNLKLDFGIKIGEDSLANYYLFKRANKIVYDNTVKYDYVVRGSSITHASYSPHWIIGYGKMLRQIAEEEGENSPLWTDIQAAIVRFCLEHALYILYTRENKQYYDALATHAKKNWRFVLKHPEKFSKEDKIKMALIKTNKSLARKVYKVYRDRRNGRD